MIHARITFASTAHDNARMHKVDEPDSPAAELSAAATLRSIIEKLRVDRGFRSRRALALAAGLQQPTLQRFLDGKSAAMEVQHVMALARTLGVTVSELLGEVPLRSAAVEARELERIYMALPETHRRAVLAAARGLAHTDD